MSVPMKDGPFAYGSSFKKGGEQPRFFRTPRDGGAEEIVLDGDREAEGKAYFRIGGVDHSGDHGRLVWGFDDKGSEFFTLRTRDVAAASDLPDIITDTAGAGVWDAANDGFFLYAVGPEPPAFENSVPSAWHGRRRRLADLRGNRPGFLHECRRHPRPQMGHDHHQRPRDVRIPSPRRKPALGRAQAGRGARGRPAIRP